MNLIPKKCGRPCKVTLLSLSSIYIHVIGKHLVIHNIFAKDESLQLITFNFILIFHSFVGGLYT